MVRHTFLLIILLMGACSKAYALTASVTVISHSVCGQPLGGVAVNANGGVPPYMFLWNNGGTEGTLLGLYAGVYSVIVTDAVGTTASGQGEVLGLSAYPSSTVVPMSYCNGMHPFVVFWGGTEYGLPPDPMTGTSHGPGPYTFQAQDYATNYGEWQEACGSYSYYLVGFEAPPGANVTVNYQDGSGCPGSFFYPVPGPITLPTIQVVDVTGSCTNGAIGMATLSVFAPDQTNYRIRLKNSSGQVVPNACSALTFFDPTASHVYTGLAPGTYWAVSDIDMFGLRNDVQVACSDSISFVIPDLGTTCGTVSGRIYIDNNANCTYNGGENNVPGTIIEITPGPYYATTTPSGTYTATLPYGTYQFTEQHPVVEQNCPLNVTLAGAQLINRNIGCAGGMPLDARVLIANGAARPGFEILYVVDVDNLTTATMGTTTLTVNVDPALTFVNMTGGGSVTGNTYTWNLSMTSAFQHREVRLRMRVPPDIGLLGSSLITTATLTTANTDVDLSNNTVISQQLVTGSYDPNDKLVRTSSGGAGTYLIGQDDWLDYTIRFQNTGTDTAFNVVITDTLPSTLDPATAQWGPASHACTRTIAANGTLKFIFTNILLPDSGRNEPLSHGFVNFRIRPDQPLTPGTTIENTANIYFDFNPPVITEPSVLNVVSPLRVDARAWLGGAFHDQTGLMHDALRTLDLLPLVEPYTALGYDHSGGGGGERISPALFNTTGPTAIVDWVLLELRSSATPGTVLHSRAVLLLRDGRITDKDGTSPVAFNAPEGSYHLALRHRNHLGVMSAAPVSLGAVATTWDARTTTTPLHGVDPTRTDDTRRELWPGDVNFNGEVKYTGAGNDRDPVLVAIGSVISTQVVNAYHTGDVNMDGMVKYTGDNNDRELILQTIGGTMSTAVRGQQLP